MFAFLFHYILDDYVVWCGEVVWRSVLVSLAVCWLWMLLDGDVVAYLMSYVVCVCVFGAEKDDMSRSLE